MARLVRNNINNQNTPQPEEHCENWQTGLLSYYQRALKEDRLKIYGYDPIMEGGPHDKNPDKVYKWCPNKEKRELSLLDTLIEHTKTLSGNKRRTNEIYINNIQYIMTLLALRDEKQLTEKDKFFLMANLAVLHKPFPTNAERCESDNRAATVRSYAWHQLTEFRHIDDVKKYYPADYNFWLNNGMIPEAVIKKAWDECMDGPVEKDPIEEAEILLEDIRKNVPEDSELRQPHENWYEEYKDGAVYNELFGD